ncbi:hypothetical protein F5Y06DRAFT_11287 [Hypoxylon sp. FL0890]|nr:hypothetical protein F5Y06DRAFT_11287 [Hypoxylon sp. FL0890]
MDSLRNFWPQIVDGLENAKALVQGKTISQLVSRRSVETLVTRTENYSNGAKAVGSVLLLLQLAVVVSILVTLDYSLGKVFPVLATVEDEAPPSYAAVCEKYVDEPEDLAEKKAALVDDDPTPPPKPITRSIRSIYRHLCSISGKRSLFRGGICWVIYRIAFSMTASLLATIPFMPVFVAVPIASLLTSPLYTAWIHVVITEPSDKSFWRRMPRFGLVLRATALPTLLLGVVDGLKDKIASTMVIFGPLGGQTHRGDVSAVLLKSTAMLLMWILVQIPLEVVLTRVQASLLPREDRTIVPLDRALTLDTDEGKEYVSMLDAWKSFSRAAWVRLMNVYAMTIMICILFYVVVGCIAVAEFLLVPLLFTSAGGKH